VFTPENLKIPQPEAMFMHQFFRIAEVPTPRALAAGDHDWAETRSFAHA